MRNILVLVDDPHHANSKVHFALQIALKMKANLLLGHAAQRSLTKELVDEQKNDLMLLTEKLKKSLPYQPGTAESPMITCMVEQADVAEFALRMVEREGVDLIVIGPQKSAGFEHFLFGAVVDVILDKANCAVLVVPENISFNGFKRITFAADFSCPYQFALRYFATLARCFNAKLTVNNVSNVSFPKKIAEGDILKAVNATLGEGFPLVDYHTLRGKDVKAALKTALEDKEVDLLCLVHRQYSLLRNLLHNSLSKQMVKKVILPIFILPYTAAPDEVQFTDSALEQFCFNTAEGR